MKEIDFLDVLGKRMLIYGDVGAGKTRLTVCLLEQAVRLGFSEEITVIDMAPRNRILKGIRVGGRLSEATTATSKLRYHAPRIIETPRLAAKNSRELLDLVEKNKRCINPLLRKYIGTPTSILFVNDVSIYLQSGDFDTIATTIIKASTAVLNGYYGRTFTNDFSTGLSAIERKLMEKLIAMMDLKIRL